MQRMRIQAEAEVSFFRDSMSSLVDAGVTGCDALVERTHKMFLRFLAQEWTPTTIRKLSEAIVMKRFENAKLGLPAFDSVSPEMAKKVGHRLCQVSVVVSPVRM